jgi:hypothetical protein
MNAKLRKERAPDKRANDSDQEITDDSEPNSLHNLAGQPSSDETDH